jgi:hypothetical protein
MSINILLVWKRVCHWPVTNGKELCRCKRKMASAAILSYQNGGFLLLSSECSKCNTSHLPNAPRASPITLGNHEEQCIQPTGNDKKVKNRLRLVRSDGTVAQNVKFEEGCKHKPSPKGKEDWQAFRVDCLRTKKAYINLKGYFYIFQASCGGTYMVNL